MEKKISVMKKHPIGFGAIVTALYVLVVVLISFLLEDIVYLCVVLFLLRKKKINVL